MMNKALIGTIRDALMATRSSVTVGTSLHTDAENALRCLTQLEEAEEHNGWTNYETWLVKLWFDNEEAANATAHALPRLYSLDTGALAGQLKSLAEDMTVGDGAASLGTDLINSALAEVNWQEIARHIDEEARDNG